jgi:beta-lactamase regulating signal transducer with metallopeptidase domain
LAILVTMALVPVVTFLRLHALDSSGPIAVAVAIDPASLVAPQDAALPWTNRLVLFWLAGIAGLSVRALGGWWMARALTRQDTLAVPDDLLRRCRALQRRLVVTWPVHFLLSHRIAVPLVIGAIRPVVLIPVAALSGLSPAQLDALIAHELAHIRRMDTIINVFLAAAETVLFYHPAIWWISRQIRTEREHCCDDVAVAACGDAGLYVEALTSLESWKAAGALAANGGQLKNRVARLLNVPAAPRRFSPAALAGLAMIGLAAGSMAMAERATTAQSDFAVSVVDDSVDANAKSAPPGDVRMPAMLDGKRTFVWIKRQTLMTGMLADAKAATDAGRPIVDVRLNPDGGQRFAALTRANVGNRVAVIVNGTVITAPKVLDPILGAKLQIDGFRTPEDARKTAARMMAAAAPAPANPHGQ